MKCLVTGGAGFIGSHLVDKLEEMGAEVSVLDDFSTSDGGHLPSSARLVRGSVTSPEILREAAGGMDYVFHTAALPRIQPSFDDPVGHEMVNVVGAIRCLEALKGTPVKKFVISSSSACYGTPEKCPTGEDAPIRCLSPYALQKYAAEQYSLILGERFGVPVVALRYFNVYGPRSYNPKNPFNAYSSVIGIFHNRKKEGLPLLVTGDGEQSRDFVHVYDVAQANIAAALSEKTGRVYNVGTGTSYTVNEIAALIGGPVEHVPEREGEARMTLADIGRIRAELGWEPKISLEEGLNLLDD
ncbi:MAG: NAD-dependent epimerase/dehydratase family protein [Nitrospinota bacterium]